MQTTELTKDTVRLSRTFGATRLSDGERAANEAAKASLAPSAGRVLPPLLAIVLVAAIAYNALRPKRG